MRTGEVDGLQWRYVDFDHRLIIDWRYVEFGSLVRLVERDLRARLEETQNG